MKKCFKEFEEKMKKVAKEAEKEKEAHLAEMGYLRDHCVVEIMETLASLMECITPYIDAFQYKSDTMHGIIITSESAVIDIKDAQVVAHFDDKPCLEFFLPDEPMLLLSDQVKTAKAVHEYIMDNLDGIEEAALNQCRSMFKSPDLETVPVRYVSADIL
jgi:hypothetical protein